MEFPIYGNIKHGNQTTNQLTSRCSMHHPKKICSWALELDCPHQPAAVSAAVKFVTTSWGPRHHKLRAYRCQDGKAPVVDDSPISKSLNIPVKSFWLPVKSLNITLEIIEHPIKDPWKSQSLVDFPHVLPRKVSVHSEQWGAYAGALSFKGRHAEVSADLRCARRTAFAKQVSHGFIAMGI